MDHSFIAPPYHYFAEVDQLSACWNILKKASELAYTSHQRKIVHP